MQKESEKKILNAEMETAQIKRELEDANSWSNKPTLLITFALSGSLPIYSSISFSTDDY